MAKVSDFTDEEIATLNSLTEAWSRFAALPVQHPDDQDEFKFFIHAAQRILLTRGARRSNPYVFRFGGSR